MLLILVALFQWPITAVAIYFAVRERQTALTFTVGVFVVLSLASTVGAVLGFVTLNDVPAPPGFYASLLVALFLIIAMIQPLWAIAVALGRFK